MPGWHWLPDALQRRLLEREGRRDLARLGKRLPGLAAELGRRVFTDGRIAYVLGGFEAPYGIELVGVRTGWPYGEFSYGVDLGPMLLGEVPFGLPVFFFPLVLNAYLLVLLLLGSRAESTAVRLLGTLATVMVIDLVLDPGAVAIGFWTYEVTQFYGVPWQNYVGWLLSGSVAVLLFDLGFDRAGLRRRLRSCPFMLDDLVSFVLLWGGINLFYVNWVPVGLSALLGTGLLWTDRFDFVLSDTRLGRAAWR
jgi:putative membrane protein